MHNYSMPGLVKTFFDCVIWKGITFDIGANLAPKGLLQGKSALGLYSSAISYQDNEKYKHIDMATTLTKFLFQHMGYSSYDVIGIGTNKNEDTKANMIRVKEKIDNFVKENLTK